MSRVINFGSNLIAWIAYEVCETGPTSDFNRYVNYPSLYDFVPSYYVSASLQDSAFSQSYNKGNLNLALDEKVFQRGIENLSLKNVNLAVLLVSTAQEMLKINQSTKVGKRQELFIKLKQRLFITQAKDTLDFKLHVTKNAI